MEVEELEADAEPGPGSGRTGSCRPAPCAGVSKQAQEICDAGGESLGKGHPAACEQVGVLCCCWSRDRELTAVILVTAKPSSAHGPPGLPPPSGYKTGCWAPPPGVLIQ